MKKKKILGRTGSIIISLMIIFALFAGIGPYMLPGGVAAYCEDNINGASIAPFVRLDCDSGQIDASDAKLLEVISDKESDINLLSGKKLIAGGVPFGVKLYTDGIMVVGISEVDGENGNVNPGYTAGLRCGDIIKAINGELASSIAQIGEAANKSNGESVNLTVKRGENELDLSIQPIKSKSENLYKFGLWIRDSTAGIGTVTFIDPDTGAFGGLGHGICDVDTSILLPMREGSVSNVTINGVEKGLSGSPGELKGFFGAETIGKLVSNTECGVFGVIDTQKVNGYDNYEIGLKDSVAEGAAYILCTLENNTIEKFDIEIEKINHFSKETKNFVIKVTDTDLLEKTGGIVQGMSGSPIIQNNKLIGAVTHVLVDDPQRGYGIFIENMIANSPKVRDN